MRNRNLLTLAASIAIAALAAAGAPLAAQDEPYVVTRVAVDLSQPDPDAAYWQDVPVVHASLMAQPMIRPRPKEATTTELDVQAVHDGRWLAFRLRWKDEERSEAGRLGEYSDAAAIEFPMHPAESPPPIFMGNGSAPVHIFHWRAQYQHDHEVGKPTMKDLYPNLSIDMYPMEYRDPGTADPAASAREQYSPGRAVGNPQSFPKSGVDEIYAEGFSTSSVQESAAVGHADWKDGVWTLVIVRPLVREGGSSFAPGDHTFAAFAIWQGGKGEVGARKCVTMTWTPLAIATGKEEAPAPAGGAS